MSYRPCFLIPIYNHRETIAATVRALAAHALPIIVVDDGSDEATQATLAGLAGENPLMHLVRLPYNSGKGAAVMRGFAAAESLFCTHALQIDADGQHDLSDVPRFLARGAARPDAAICGAPIYDESVPKGRRYGRYISHVWVWIETLSLDIKDSMCGYRLYPLDRCCELMRARRFPPRMAFDTEIIVRLYWRGVPVESLATRVVYPRDGLSHFDMLRDNLRISAMHARLAIGMIPRAPMLLWRKGRGIRAGTLGDDDRSPHWSPHWSRLAERGGQWGIRIVQACYRLLGRRATRLLLHPVVFYYLLTSARARHASLAYLRRVQARGGLPPASLGWRHAYKHLLAFAESGVDKIGAWMGEVASTAVDFPQRDEFERLRRSGRGALFIGAHLGNLEMTRAIATGEGLAKINAVVYTENARRFTAALRAANEDFALNLLPVNELGPDTAIMLREKIDAGELLVIVGDRTPPAENGRISSAQFLGDTAAFAQGPFLLASLLECPVYLFFCLREADGYRIHLEHFAELVELPRKTRRQSIDAYVQLYAARLEAYCLRAPYQWFNFYDFWREAAEPRMDAAATTESASESALGFSDHV
jgi:predicted LPLAT superfamily acyltransferase